MNASDMSKVIVPKSDQINSDDLIGGPLTITVREVQINSGQEQPVSIFFDGSEKAFRPCKSMSRVLVATWGADAKTYVGRSMTLYRDPSVKWGGLEVGGIRISHMSHLAKVMTLALTATKGSRKPFVVKPLDTAGAPPGSPRTAETPPDAPTLTERVSRACTALSAATTQEALTAAWDRMAALRDDAKADPEQAERLIKAHDDRAFDFAAASEPAGEAAY